jgi:hypothetical protein
MIEILQVRSEPYSSWSEKNVNVQNHGGEELPSILGRKSIDRMAQRENARLERLWARLGCGKAEDGSG